MESCALSTSLSGEFREHIKKFSVSIIVNAPPRVLIGAILAQLLLQLQHVASLAIAANSNYNRTVNESDMALMNPKISKLKPRDKILFM